ncbi:PREDICTED: uncharacterized protein LOC108618887 [Drosophila arizonae]|uniref:Uncharacterized protein LOC108618887 n=1 Tax=Drosophila arizonae TaxID=7263 RepID=A0ABM1PTP2_DROAR|nr:PREDICTED: uncharacterized protein LOC108618887 [Drosophila arizonae]
MGMAGLSEDFITLTQLNCVQQCSALIYSPKPRNYLTAAALFSVYCGVVIYRSYRNHQAKMQARREAALIAAREELPVFEEYTVEAPTLEQQHYPAEPTVPEPAHVDDPASDETSLPAAP